MKKDKKTAANIKIAGTIVLVIFIMTFISFSFIGNEVLKLSEDRLELASKNYAGDISAWSDRILGELDIYKNLAEELGIDDSRVFDVLKTSYGANVAYPYGLYWGDENGSYFDSSGWEPDENFVVTERNWYTEGIKQEEFVFGEPYIDAMTKSACISVAARLESGSAESVLAADVYFDYPQSLVSEIAAEDIENAFFVTGRGRMIVADADASMVGRFMDDDRNPDIYKDINSLIENDKTGQSILKSGRETYFVDINKITNTEWYFITFMSKSEVLGGLRRIEAVMLLSAAAAAAVLVFLALRVKKKIDNR